MHLPYIHREGKRRGFDPCPDSTSLPCFYFEVSLIPRGPVCKFYKICASQASRYDSDRRSHPAKDLGLPWLCRILRGQQGHSPTTPNTKHNPDSAQLLHPSL